MNSMFLLKDKSIHICKKPNNFQLYLKENFDNCKYIMIPINDDNNTFVLNKPKSYMKDFYKAKISYQLCIMDFQTLDRYEECKELEPVYIEANTINELVSTLHSLNRIRYYNKVANSNESYTFTLYDFVYFQLEIVCKYNKSYQTIFDKKIVGNRFDRFGTHEIFELIKPIYNPISKLPKDSKFVLMNDKEWKFSKQINTNNIIGFILPCTKSISFINYECFDKITSIISSVFCSAVTYNPEDTTNITKDLGCLLDTHEHCEIRYHDLWTHNLYDIIEYINYVQYITIHSIVASELITYGEIKNKMIMEPTLIVSISSKEGRKELTYDFKHNELSLSKFYEIIMDLDN